MAKKDKFEDISSSSMNSGFKERMSYAGERIRTFFVRNRKRNLKVILSVLICVVLIVAAMGGAYVRKILSLINYNTGTEGDPEATFATDEEENLNFETMYDIESADSIKDLIKSWALNGGEKLYSKSVINVLLIGEDNDDGSHRSDSMILASINTKTKKITLCSFLRDTYSYMNINGSERYDKTNHAYSWAGAAKVMEVLSDNYKIKIDHFVSIDFASFEKVIDLLGGVTVPITESEARFMNRTTRVKGFEAGENVKLNGKRALIYSRIRKLDSEIERTRRQRNVIASVVKNIKASSLSDINKVVETFLPYVTTNYKYSEIISLATTALSDKWLSYEIIGMVEPSDEFRTGVSGFRTYTGYLDVWIADYVKAARELQLALYDTTNISIGQDHISAVDLIYGGRITDNGGGYNSETTNYSDESSSVYEDTTTSSWGIDRYFTRPGEDRTYTRLIDRFTSGTNPGEEETEESTDYVPDDTDSSGYVEESTDSYSYDEDSQY